MITAEIKVFPGDNTYYNQNFKAPTNVNVFSEKPKTIKIIRTEPPYVAIRAKEEQIVKIEIQPVEVPEDAPEEEKEKVTSKVLKWVKEEVSK